MQQPKIHEHLVQRLNLVACAYEMTVSKMLNHILAVALDELDGKQVDHTVCIPLQQCPQCQLQLIDR